MTVPADDWRRMGQEQSLLPGTEFAWSRYMAPRADWDHDHCSMCMTKFVEATAQDSQGDSLYEGYATTDAFERGAGYEWVCKDCFGDFSEEFGWVAVDESDTRLGR